MQLSHVKNALTELDCGCSFRKKRRIEGGTRYNQCEVNSHFPAATFFQQPDHQWRREIVYNSKDMVNTLQKCITKLIFGTYVYQKWGLQ